MKGPLCILLAALLAACATDPRPATPSGNLEVTLFHVRPDCVRAAMADALVSYGYPITSRQDGRLIAGRMNPKDSKEERLTVLFLAQPASDAMRIVIYGNLVTHPGTDFESLQPIRPSQIEQDQMDIVKQKIQGNCASRKN